MPQELNLHFQNTQQVIIHFAQHTPVTVDFTIPLTAQEREAIRHYLEVYAAQYVMDIDDQEAARVTKQLPQWGQKLFDAVFNNASAKQLFAQFINTPTEKYLLTITAQTPEILSLPWELLHDAGQFLFAFQPSMTILRRMPAKTSLPTYASQSHLRMLFIISRPQKANFIDPRTDAQAVLKAIENYPAITVEFLQPATLENLWQRLQNSELPPIDVIHFDGHGVFDKTGDLAETTMKQLNGISRSLRKFLRDLEIGANTGYLLFEKSGESGANGRDKFYVPTAWLIHLLSKTNLRLMVLSACQSAMVVHENQETEEEAIGSIAVGLVKEGVPSVLAMSYSVMVRATQLLFGEFYQEIAAGNSVGSALDKARQALLQDRKRRDLQRGQERVAIQVSDWFLPTLYQAGEDMPLISKMIPESPTPPRHNLPILPNAGFWGRRRELWQIENWFNDGIRRIVISGFSGQGKTFLAQELGRWLLQTKRFDMVVFVDYSGYQGQDTVQWAVTTLGSVVKQNLVDVAAANAVLQTRRILLILDNLEVYMIEKQDTLQELLTVAQQWSLLGDTRVLITTRPVALGHEAYQVGDDNADFRSVVLAGLDEKDALHYFEQLLVLSDNRVRLPTEELLRWFAKVQFHPLSIGLLARALETEDLVNLETRLNQLMVELPDNPVEMALRLVIEQLDEETQQWLSLLGVFQGGAMEDVLLDITEIPPETWAKLRPLLESTGLIQVETLPNIKFPYLQFHPALASALASNNQELRQRHQRRYYELSHYLYFEDQKSPLEPRAIVKRELPNLLFAVKGALAEATDYAVEFVDKMKWFLYDFGLQRDLIQLNQQAAKLAGEAGSQNWFLNQSSIGEQLFNARHYAQAAYIFTEILTGLGTTVSYNRCLTLGRLGRCFSFQEQSESAAAYYQQGLETAQQLEQTQQVQRLTGLLYTDLADVLRNMGRYADAQAAYEQSLTIATEQNDDRQMGVVNGQLGILAHFQGNLVEAEKRYQATLAIFQRFHEPSGEAVGWHQLGIVYQDAKQWEAAEHAYRQAANIRESQGNLVDAAQTWNNLAVVTKNMGKWVDAEAWYRKAIEGFENSGQADIAHKAILNLANLLQNQPTRLAESQKLAEQALAINKTLDPATAQIWTTYDILADIADKQSDAQAAKVYRRSAREAKANFAGTRYELKREHSELIVAVAQGKNVEAVLEKGYGEEDWKNIKTAIQQILAGERDAEKLCEPLTFNDAQIITAILEGIAEPESLKWFEQDETDG